MLEALALFRSGQALVHRGAVTVHRVLVPGLQVQTLHLAQLELEALAGELEGELEAMSGAHIA